MPDTQFKDTDSNFLSALDLAVPRKNMICGFHHYGNSDMILTSRDSTAFLERSRCLRREKPIRALPRCVIFSQYEPGRDSDLTSSDVCNLKQHSNQARTL